MQQALAELFHAATPSDILILFGTYIIAFIIKGVFGYGAVLPLVIGGSLVIDAHDAVLLAALVNMVTQIFMLPDGVREGDRRIALRVILFAMPATLLGVWIFKGMKPQSLQLLVSILVVVLLLAESSKLRDLLVPLVIPHVANFGRISGFIAGILTGLVGAGSMLFLSIYLKLEIADSLRFRGTAILIATAMMAWRMGILAVSGLLTVPLLAGAVVFLPVSIAASFVGRAMARRLAAPAFFKAYQVFLVGASLLLLWQALR